MWKITRLGLELRLLLLLHATWSLLFIGDKPPLLTLPQQGSHSAATESIRLVVEAIPPRAIPQLLPPK